MRRTPGLICVISCLILGACSKAPKFQDNVNLSEWESQPYQTELDQSNSIDLGSGWLMARRATYDITAVVLIKESHFSDAFANTLPLDLTLAWGPMIEPKLLNQFSISHTNRFFQWKTNQRRIEGQDVYALSENLANTHYVGENQILIEKLKQVPVGSLIRIKGYLVNLDNAQLHEHIRTSLTRKDRGPGACEVIEPTEVEILKKSALSTSFFPW